MADADAGGWQALRGGRVLLRCCVGAYGAGDGFEHCGGDGSGTVEDHGDWLGSRTEDSTPTLVAPPSRTASMRRSRSCEDVGSGGWADAAEAIGAGGGEGKACGLDERVGDGMGWHADAYEGAVGGDSIGDFICARKQEGEGAGPEGFDEALCLVGYGGYLVEHGAVADVDDEGVPVGAVFGEEDFGDCVGVERVGSEAVDGFGGEGYGAAVAEDLGGAGDVLRAGG